MLLLWLGCSPTPSGADTGPLPARDDSGLASGLTPLWSAEQAALELERLAAIPLPMGGRVAGPYLELVRGGDEACPNAPDDQFPEGRVPLGGCTSGTGYTYVGLSEYRTIGEGGHSLWGDFRIVNPEGRVMEMGGTQRVTVGDWASLTVSGSMVYDGAEGWLGKGFGAVLEIVTVDGVSTLEGGLGSLSDSDAVWWALELDASCASGELRARDPQGGWYILSLEDCSCGPVRFNGQELGEACVDLSALRAQL